MRRFGSFLLIFGLLSSILKLLKLGIAFLLLIWVDFWGPEIGWAIRIAMIVIGAALWGLGIRNERAAARVAQDMQPPPPGRI